MCITGGWVSSLYYGDVLPQDLDNYSGKIAVHSDRAIYNVPHNIHGLSFGGKKITSQTAVSPGMVLTSLHACNHDQLSPSILPGSSVYSSTVDGR